MRQAQPPARPVVLRLPEGNLCDVLLRGDEAHPAPGPDARGEEAVHRGRHQAEVPDPEPAVRDAEAVLDQRQREHVPE